MEKKHDSKYWKKVEKWDKTRNKSKITKEETYSPQFWRQVGDVPYRGISASRKRGSGIPWFSRALFWERLVQPPGSGTNKFGALAHFFPPLPSLLWLNRIHQPILGTGLSSESSTFDLFFFRFSFNDLCFYSFPIM